MKYFLETLYQKNETLFYFGLVCLLGGIVCLLLSKVNPNPILGVSGWIKPFKFFISSAIMAWTMGFYMQYLDNPAQVTLYNWSMIILLSLEIILITYQAAHGRISHFNQEDTFGKVVFQIMGGAITLFMIHTAYIGVLFFQQTKIDAPELLVLAIRLSIIITVIFAFEGFVMGAMLRHTIGAPDGGEGLPIVNWSKNHGDLRIAHFLGMHALQLIPLVTYFLATTRKEVYIISGVYFLFVTYTLIHALQGKPLLGGK